MPQARASCRNRQINCVGHTLRLAGGRQRRQFPARLNGMRACARDIAVANAEASRKAATRNAKIRNDYAPNFSSLRQKRLRTTPVGDSRAVRHEFKDCAQSTVDGTSTKPPCNLRRRVCWQFACQQGRLSTLRNGMASLAVIPGVSTENFAAGKRDFGESLLSMQAKLPNFCARIRGGLLIGGAVLIGLWPNSWGLNSQPPVQ